MKALHYENKQSLERRFALLFPHHYPAFTSLKIFVGIRLHVLGKENTESCCSANESTNTAYLNPSPLFGHSNYTVTTATSVAFVPAMHGFRTF